MAQTSLGANVFRRTKRKLRQGSFGGEDTSPGGIIGKVRGAGRSLPLKASVASRGRFSRGRCLPGGANDKWFYIKMEIN